MKKRGKGGVFNNPERRNWVKATRRLEKGMSRSKLLKEEEE
jgi:hypothetical protein